MLSTVYRNLPAAALVTTLAACGGVPDDGATATDQADMVLAIPAPATFGDVPSGLPDLSGDYRGDDSIEIVNHGTASAGAFRIAVLRGAGSYSIAVPALIAGAYRIFDVTADCFEGVGIIIDPDDAIAESDKSNNAFSFTASCSIDPGPVLNPVEE